MRQIFWTAMDIGGFNAAIAQDVMKFNGKRFKAASANDYVLLLTPSQIDGLMRAAKARAQAAALLLVQKAEALDDAKNGTAKRAATDPDRHAGFRPR